MQASERSASDLMIEEYKALRAESLRSAGIFSTTIWIGITGFIVTGGAAASLIRFVDDLARLLALALIVLVVQSVAATVMFLSEYWKYIRVGIYIRSKVEDHFSIEESGKRWYPLGWEHWIQGRRRAAWLPLVSVAVLQLPIGLTLLLFASGAFFPASDLWLPTWGRALTIDPSLSVLLGLVTAVDSILIIIIAYSVIKEVRALSGERLAFNRQLVAKDQHHEL